VHGYAQRESERLLDQACALTDLLHFDTRYPEGSRVLEAGCGVGAQTVILAGNSPGARLTSVDISEASLREAARRVAAAGFANVAFRQADLYSLPFDDASFDHVFVCFVLEHLRDPAAVLSELRRVLSPGGSLTVIEGDHGSAFFHPDSARARRAIECLSDLQAEAGGDSRIGRRLYPLLRSAGFPGPRVSPRTVYADAGRPEQVEGFTRNTFIAMVEGVREQAIGAGKLTAEEWDAALCDLRRAAGPEGTFAYTFFKGVAVR
jgi:SAM-dependent methyltransferase